MVNKKCKYKLVELLLDFNIKKEFLRNLTKCEFSISDSVIATISQYKTPFKHLNGREIDFVFNISLEHANKPRFIYNFQTVDGTFLFPHKYTKIWDRIDAFELFALEKFAIQSIDVINSEGILLFEGAYDVILDDENNIFIQNENLNWILFRYSIKNKKLIKEKDLGLSFPKY